jgi:hypothetical protein
VWRRTGQPTVIGPIGDLDEAGLAIVHALTEDVDAFVAAGLMLVLVIAGLSTAGAPSSVNSARSGSPRPRSRQGFPRPGSSIGAFRTRSLGGRFRALDAQQLVHAGELQHPGHGSRR